MPHISCLALARGVLRKLFGETVPSCGGGSKALGCMIHGGKPVCKRSVLQPRKCPHVATAARRSPVVPKPGPGFRDVLR